MRKKMTIAFLVASLIPLLLFFILTMITVENSTLRVLYSFIISILFALIVSFIFALLLGKNLTNPLKQIINKAQIIATGNFTQPIEIKRSDEIGELAYTLEMTRQRLKQSREEIQSWNVELEERVNERTEALENANKELTETNQKLEKITKELEEKNERLDKEIYQGRVMQMSMLPTVYPEIDGWDFYGACVPAPEIGGDYFDFIETERDKIGFAIGDVAGSGIMSSMLMAMAKSSIYTQAQNSLQPSRIFPVLNNVVNEVSESGKLLTFFYGVLDTRNGEVNYANAGHLSPLLITEKEPDSPVLIKATSPPIGTKENWIFKSKRIRLDANDTLVLYTDGVIKSKSEDGESFGVERFKQVVIDNASASSSDIINAVFEELSTFCGATQQVDDITMLVVKRK